MRPTRNSLMSTRRKIDKPRLLILCEIVMQINLSLAQTLSNLSHQKIKVDEVELGPKNILNSTLSRLGTKCDLGKNK